MVETVWQAGKRQLPLDMIARATEQQYDDLSLRRSSANVPTASTTAHAEPAVSLSVIPLAEGCGTAVGSGIAEICSQSGSVP